MKDIHGQAILDYYQGDRSSHLILHNSYGDPEEMPVEIFFRESDDFTEIEKLAMAQCRGKVLDIGAAAGTHSLFLQAMGADVVALENSPGCVETLEQSG
jgi:2-polyprenyl-3-methyl-5-hydroxy-6-metoxy-1,4-benzoquinol methylase